MIPRTPFYLYAATSFRFRRNPFRSEWEWQVSGRNDETGRLVSLSSGSGNFFELQRALTTFLDGSSYAIGKPFDATAYDCVIQMRTEATGYRMQYFGRTMGRASRTAEAWRCLTRPELEAYVRQFSTPTPHYA